MAAVCRQKKNIYQCVLFSKDGLYNLYIWANATYLGSMLCNHVCHSITFDERLRYPSKPGGGLTGEPIGDRNPGGGRGSIHWIGAFCEAGGIDNMTISCCG